jgi:uncharacterized membrane protein
VGWRRGGGGLGKSCSGVEGGRAGSSGGVVGGGGGSWIILEWSGTRGGEGGLRSLIAGLYCMLDLGVVKRQSCRRRDNVESSCSRVELSENLVRFVAG